MADKRELLFILKGKDQGAKKAFDDLGDAAEDARDDTDDMRSGLRALDGQLAKSRSQVESLRKEISKSGDLGLIKDLEKAQREVNKLTKQRKLLVGEDEGRESGEQFSIGFIARVGPLLARAPLSPHLLAGITAGLPAITAAVGGAVTLGLAGGAVAAGLKLASKDPAVQAAGKEMGDEIGLILAQSSRPFVPATLKSIGLVRAEFRSLRPELEDIFGSASEYLLPLTRGALGFVRELAPGLAAAVRNAEPLIEFAEEHGPELGRTLGDAFERLSRNAENSKDTLDALLTTLEGMVTVTSKAVELLSSDVAQGVADPLQLQKIIGGGLETERVLKRMHDEVVTLDPSFVQLGRTMGEAAEAARSYADASLAIADANLSAAEANLRYKDALTAAKDAMDSKRKVSAEEDQALIDLARSSNTLISSLDRQGASADALGRKHQAARQDLIKAAEAAGYSSDKAEELADDYLAIPRRIDTKINADSATAEDNLRKVRNLIAQIKSKRVVITVDYHGRESIRVGGRNVPIGSLGGLSEGGYVDGPGPKGKDSELRALAPGEYVLPDDIVDKVGVTALDSLRRGDMDAWARQAGAAMPAPSPRRTMAAGHGGAVRGGAPFGWAGMERSFVQFLVSAITGAGGDPSVLRIGRGRA